jgi:NAD(P)-dependent dehydrogenase (short-subunit alcohol dehydrogenase family)
MLQKIAVVTGGNRGIGHVITTELARSMPVLNLARGKEPAVRARTDYPVHRLDLDLSDLTALETQMAAWLDDHPHYRVSDLILNAANLTLGRLADAQADDLERVFRTNVFSSVLLVGLLSRRNAFHREGSHVTYLISSLARTEPTLTFAGIGLYSATKAAIGRIAMVQAREFSLASPHIRVARVHPGIVDTGMQSELRSHPDLDPLFAVKTAGLPPYRPGDWAARSPGSAMRTITARMAADFVLWASSRGDHQASEFDYYFAPDYHAIRDRRLAGHDDAPSGSQRLDASMVSS